MNIYSKQKKHPLRVPIMPSKLHTNDYFILSERLVFFDIYRLSPRPISNSQLHTLLCFHLCPIYLVVFKGSYSRRRDISS